MSPLLVWMTATAVAGPWVREPGAFYAKGELSTFIGDPGMAPENSPGQPHAETHEMSYRAVSASAYLEVGLVRRLQLVGSIPYVAGWNTTDDARFLNLSGGDAELGLAYALAPDKPLAFEVKARGPTYRDRTEERVDQYGALGAEFPTAGDGSSSVDATLQAGGGWAAGKVTGWVQAAAGARYRFGPHASGVVYDAAVGLTPNFGWVGLGVSGVNNLQPDLVTRSSVSGRAFAAVKASEAVAIEAAAGWMPMATYQSTGISAGLGVSVSR